ncbi:DMT family transporter [Anaerotignum sp.]|uniref:DMT family transporter n=1 Tax=Anaerotignum sp. TaxID=2039241 RepID=UPI00332CB67C
MIYYMVAIANGFLNTINKMVNVKAGECLGTARGALINYIEATIIAFCLVYITGKGGEFRIEYIKEVPVLFYLGSVCGLAAMIFLIIGTRKTGAMTSTVLMLLGQLGTSIALDYVFFDTFRPIQILGIFLILVGIAWKEKIRETGNQKEVVMINEEEIE